MKTSIPDVVMICKPLVVHGFISLRDTTSYNKTFFLCSWDQSDCETIMVDPHANVYLVSKALNANGYLFKVPKSAWNSGHRVHITTLGHVPANSTHHDPVGGDISRDGNEVLVKV